jgi:hypothetical protein
MSRVGAYDSQHKTASVETVSGRIAGGGSGAVGAILAGKGFSVKYISTGRYQILTDTNYNFIIGGGPSLKLESGHLAYNVGVAAYQQGGAGGCTVDFIVASAGTATDLATDEELWFSVDFCRSARQ